MDEQWHHTPETKSWSKSVEDFDLSITYFRGKYVWSFTNDEGLETIGGRELVLADAMQSALASTSAD